MFNDCCDQVVDFADDSGPEEITDQEYAAKVLGENWAVVAQFKAYRKNYIESKEESLNESVRKENILENKKLLENLSEDFCKAMGDLLEESVKEECSIAYLREKLKDTKEQHARVSKTYEKVLSMVNSGTQEYLSVKTKFGDSVKERFDQILSKIVPLVEKR